VSCPNELTWSIYVDGELEGDALRRAQMHLVSCRDCRSRVVALRDEATAIANALAERAAAPAPLRRRATPERSLAWGVPVAIAGVTLLLALAGAWIELRLPGVLDLVHPARLMGAYEMAFDSIFLLRRRLPGLVELATAVGAVSAVSALGCAAVHALSQRLTKPRSLLLVLSLAVLLPEAARAIDYRGDRDTHIAADETVAETLVCTGEVVTIDGTVDGDLVVAAERITLRGRVTGDVYAFGDEVEIDGTVQGSVRVAAERARLGGRVEGSVLLAGDRLTLAPGSRVERDATIFGSGAQVDGATVRDVAFAGEWIELRGEIGRDLQVFAADQVKLLDGARIGRDLRAKLADGPEAVEQASGATVGGEIRVETGSMVHEHHLSHYLHPRFYLTAVVAAAAAFVFGLLMYLLDPRLFEADPPDARGFFRSLGIGFLVVLAGPVALLLVGLTVIGLPVAALGLYLLILALYGGYVLVAGLVGQRVLAPSGPGLGPFAPSLLVGVLILAALSVLPFVGSAVRIVAVLFGLGCLVDRVRGLHALNLRGIRSQG
jgi:cytoskeletal protein CcmA (bactofilin family)